MKKKWYWLPPGDMWTFFQAESDDAFRRRHPCLYPLLVVCGIVELVGPGMLYGALTGGMGLTQGQAFLGFVGSVLAGVGLFNLTAAALGQYLGHLVTIICLGGGGLCIVLSLIV